MARRIPHPQFRTFAITLEDVPPGVSEEMIAKLIGETVKDLGTVTTTRPIVKTPKLIHRNSRKKGTYACTYTATIGGVEYVGCGRTFARKHGLDVHLDHVAGTFADTRRWPNYCLDSIVSSDLRDDR